MDFEVLRPMFFGLIMWTAAVYAFRRGGWEERLASVNMIVATYLSVLLNSPYNAYENIEVSVVWVDLSSLFVQQLIALRSKKFWPMWLAAFHGVTVLGHLAPLLPEIPAYMAYNAVALWGYPSWVLLAFAVYGHDKRRRALEA